MEEKQNQKVEVKKEEIKKNKYKILGNSLLTVLVLLSVATGSLIYYLIYTARNEYEQYTNTAQIDEEEPDTIANLIDTAVSNTTPSNNTSGVANSSTKKVQNEDLIVLYNGLILDVSEMKEAELKYINSLDDSKDKYVITYSNYENYSFVSSKLGTLSEEVYEGVVKIENVKKVAISENYNAIPREIKVVNAIPTIITENTPKVNDYDTSKTIIVDLDGNGTNEYILVLANKTTGYSKIILVDSKGSKISDLAYIEKSKWSPKTNNEYYLSISNVEIIDVDNDDVMEILVEIPAYEGPSNVSILKYKNGELSGTTDIECSLLP